ncbi:MULTISPECIES: KilA-N domain-containing protein [unclassified Pseudomonas]|uniref:KilA-N domain-containing protein n=1 Tax=unclassified Pseudomonas TaxID=196821 RepID=UPI00209803E0|nr:KilA-N domain-containing protein [Pseudomonas sp. 1]MCO7541819.1 KilA-N domain-containing protein [Pseudomonas sp. VA159-2]
MSNVIHLDFEGRQVDLSADGWLNATKIAKQFGKEPTAWLRQIDTLEYLCIMGDALGVNSVTVTEFNEIKGLDASKSWVRSKILALTKRTGLVTTRAGGSGGTWLHPKVRVYFGRWISTRFAVWCDTKIEALLSGAPSKLDRLNRACKIFDDRESLASTYGRGLCEWKRDKPLLLGDIERELDSLQMVLGLSNPNQPRLKASS